MVDMLVEEPPSLPDSTPPPKCTEECPPWNPDCNTSCKQLGDLCDNNAECCKGMICVEESCTPGEDDDGGPTEKPLMRVTVSGGTGGGYDYRIVVVSGDLAPLLWFVQIRNRFLRIFQRQFVGSVSGRCSLNRGVVVVEQRCAERTSSLDDIICRLRSDCIGMFYCNSTAVRGGGAA